VTPKELPLTLPSDRPAYLPGTRDLTVEGWALETVVSFATDVTARSVYEQCALLVLAWQLDLECALPERVHNVIVSWREHVDFPEMTRFELMRDSFDFINDSSLPDTFEGAALFDKVTVPYDSRKASLRGEIDGAPMPREVADGCELGLRPVAQSICDAFKRISDNDMPAVL